MTCSIHQVTISKIKESDGLSDRQISSSVSHRFLHLEVIKISHAAVHSRLVKGIQRYTHTLEGLQLIRRKHLLSDILPSFSIKRVGILQQTLIIITPKAQPYHLVLGNRLQHLLVGILVVASQA